MNLGNLGISDRVTGPCEVKGYYPDVAGVPVPVRARPWGQCHGDRCTFRNGGVEVKRRRVPGPLLAGGSRGEIYGFSNASRRRLRVRLMRFAWDRMQTFWVTLTYHNDWGADWRDWKRDFQTFCKRLRRAFPERLGLVWRLEFQERGAPHFHILLSFPLAWGGNRSLLRSFVRDAWLSVIGNCDDVAARRHGVTVVLADRNTRGRAIARLLNYIVKDMGKVDQGKSVNHVTGELMATGRTWGVRGNMLEYDECVVEFDTEEDYLEFLRALKKEGPSAGYGWYTDALSAKWQGFALIGDGFGFAGLLRPGSYRVVEGDGSIVVGVV